MRTIDQRTGLELLSHDQCIQLLRQTRLGRLAVVVDGLPTIWPVSYYVRDENCIVFRSDAGSKLAALAATVPVAFEIDGEEENYGGWSVVVKGTAKEVREPRELAQLRQLPLRSWAQGVKDHWVRISPREVSGRRIVRLDSSTVEFDR